MNTKLTVGKKTIHKTIIIPLVTHNNMKLASIKDTLASILDDLNVTMESKHSEILTELAKTLHKSPRATFSMFGTEKGNLRAIYFIPVFIDANQQHERTTYEIGRKIDLFRNAGAECAITLNYNAIREFNLKMLESTAVSSYAFLEGLLLALYRFNKYKTELEHEDTFTFSKIHLLYNSTTSSKILKNAESYCKTICIQTNAVFTARNLINEPANHRHVTDFIEFVKKELKMTPSLSMNVIETAELKKMGMNLMVSVGNASIPSNSSRLLILDTHPTSSKKQVDYVLIGKGVMFDTGGLNIKADDENLYQEKTDMAGAAIIASFILGYSKLDVSTKSQNIRIVGLLPLSQNDIGARGTHSGDVLKAYDGKSVEIVDTDAEGRLLLADALAYANKHYKDAIVIDIATLTGDQAYMSCKTFSSAISRHPGVLKRLIDAGNLIQERIVESPFLEEFRDYLESPIADIKNIGDNKCKSDTILGGVFLGQFIDPSVKWIHLDIAGTAYGMDEMKAYYPPEGSAIGVRLLFEFIGNHSQIQHTNTNTNTNTNTKRVKHTKKISRN
jgi:leucyl aminopeptidase